MGSGSLPPVNRSRQQQYGQESPRRVEKRRPLSERRHILNREAAALPKMGYSRPDVPEAPFKFQHTPPSQESEHYEMLTSKYFAGDALKKPLISTSPRSDVLSGRPPLATTTSGVSDLNADRTVQRPTSDPPLGSQPIAEPSSNQFS